MFAVSCTECRLPSRSSSLLVTRNLPSGVSATPSGFMPICTLAGLTMRPLGSTPLK